MPKDLRTYLKQVREAGPGYYVEVKRPLNPRYEVGVLQHKLAREGRNPLIFCPRITGSQLPLVTNLVGRYEMLGLALDIPLERIENEGRGIILNEYRRRCEKGLPVKEIPSAQAPVHEIVLKGVKASLDLLPITWHAEFNPERYVPIGVTMTSDPDTGAPNGGIYRMQVLDKNRLACMMVPRTTKMGNQNALGWAKLSKPMPAAVFIGHHPFASTGSINLGQKIKNEFEYTGALLGEPYEVTRAVTVDIPVPARAEIVIEGIIDPKNMGMEGPYSEMGGYYGEAQPCYVIQITAITMRRDAIYLDLHPTHPESTNLGILARESNMYDKVRQAVPGVKAVHVAPEAVSSKGFAYVSIRKRSAEDAAIAGKLAILGDVQARIAIVVDDDIDVHDEAQVLWALATRMGKPPLTFTTSERADAPVTAAQRPKTGLELAKGLKMVMDATMPLDGSFPQRVRLPEKVWKTMKVEDYV